MGYVRKSSNISPVPAMDGTWGFYANGADYLVGGWDGTEPTYKTVFKSTNQGVTWSALADFNHQFHTGATCVVNGVGYIVGGDQLSPSVDGDWRRSSHKFENETWTQIASNPGIENRCLACLVHLNSSFYLIGGQSDNSGTIAYDTVLRSDDGLETFTTILSDTKLQGFSNWLSWGSCVVHQGLIWSVCGSRHTGEHGRFIFSSPDGVTWTYRGTLRGMSRTYCQVVSHNGRLWVFNGHNGRFDSAGNPTGNLRDVWTIDVLNGGRVVQTYQGLTGWSARHAMSIWSNPQGIMCTLGTGVECWMYEI
jgi:hypothetical protein